MDEADSLFKPRESTHYSWEVSEVSELLVQMEEFRGILLCSTNFLDHVDHAAIRRFNWKVKFDYLNPDGVAFFYNRILGEMAAAPPQETERAVLRQVPHLTPGDFKIVWQKNAFREKVPHAELIAALALESRMKRAGPKRMGL